MSTNILKEPLLDRLQENLNSAVFAVELGEAEVEEDVTEGLEQLPAGCLSSTRDTTAALEGLSIDIVAWLLSYLNLQDINTVSLVSVRLLEASRSNALWKLKFESRWNIDITFSLIASGQNWHKAYQESYGNPQDLWCFHWNACFPSDGLVPGRCCIYDVTTPSTRPTFTKDNNSHDVCPPCRFFPAHPLKYALSRPKGKASTSNINNPRQTESSERIAQATDCSIRDFCQQHGVLDEEKSTAPSYCRQKAQRAFSEAATFHRTLDTRQYTAATPRQDSKSTTCLAPLRDLLFFNVTDEPLSTKEGAKELQHLREERDYQQRWEQSSPFSREQRRSPPQDFLKPAYETAHHSWHQAVLTNPDFMRPLVFRISVARPDCFTVFPSEGFLEPGQSKVVTFGVRPLGSLVATAFETINAQRHDVEDWMKQLYDEEGTLPTQPFSIRYHHCGVIPCVPARGFVPPHQPQPRQEIVGNNSTTGGLTDRVDCLWDNKQTIDYHWSGGDPTNVSLESHELRCLELSAHVNSHYPFWKFRNETLTPFDLSVDPCVQLNRDLPMLYFSAPQLYEFYSQSIYPKLQQVHLETEMSNDGQVFRSKRQKCLGCRRLSWGPRLEEMGQAFVLARLEDWVWQKRQTSLIQNGMTIVRTLYNEYRKQQDQSSTKNENAIAGQSNEPKDSESHRVAVQTQRLLYVAQNMILRYRSAAYVTIQLRNVLARAEILSDYLYGISMQQLTSPEALVTPWKKAGSFRHTTCTLSVFPPLKSQKSSTDYLQWNELVKDEPKTMDQFRHLLHTPGRYNLGPQEDSNHPGELSRPLNGVADPLGQPASATDMFFDDPLQSFRCALITLRNPRSVLVHGIYDRVPYPGKVVRRPKIPRSALRKGNGKSIGDAAMQAKGIFYHLQDALDLHHILLPSPLDTCRSFSLRRYLRNIPPLGMARYPVCTDGGFEPRRQSQNRGRDFSAIRNDEVDNIENTGMLGPNELADEDFQTSSCFRVVQLSLPKDPKSQSFATDEAKDNSRTELPPNLPSDLIGDHRDEPFAVGGFGMPNNRFVGVRNIHGAAPLLRGPGPRLLNLLWAISAQLGWAVDDGSPAASSVTIKRELLIALQWLSLTLMAAPLFWTLVARASSWVPCRPVDYLVDLPYQLTNNEMRFLSESECGSAALTVVVVWLFLGRWTERWIGRTFFRCMLEYVEAKDTKATTFLERLRMRYERRWDEICPIFLQRLSYTPSWNRRTLANLKNIVISWRSGDRRERMSVFSASAGRGLTFSGGRWGDIVVEDQSSRKLMLTAMAALGSFGCSTPHFWMNLLTVFSCSISLGLSMSLHSLEKGVTGGAAGSVGGVLKSMNLVTLVTLVTLLGQLLGSSGGVLFLAEFVVTSISFILGGAGTISASSVESWGCFFCLSSTAFWGYLFGRVALMDGIIRQKRFVRSSLFSTTLLCTSLVAVVFMWLWILLWRWDVPASLMILRTGVGLVKTARGDEVSAATGTVARSAAAEYAAKNLQ